MLALTFLGVPDCIVNSNVAFLLLRHFFHVNIFHLIVNVYALCLLYGRGSGIRKIFTAYIIAVLSDAFLMIPAIGLSDFLYATMGLRTPSLKSDWWKSSTTITFLIVTVAFVFVPNVSAVTHITSFVGGVALASIRRFFNQIVSDYGKAKRGHR